MTIHVIDRSNPLPPTTGDFEHAFQIFDGDTVLLSEGAHIWASGYKADGINASGRVNVFIDGDVHSAQSFGISMSGTLSIGRLGSVFGVEGLFLANRFDQLSSIVNNAGTVSGDDSGIYIESDHAVINNSGTITGSLEIYINPTDTGMSSLTITNTGVIEGTGSWAITGCFHGKNVVINSGLVKGSVSLGFGNDLYDGRGGSISGDIHLWSGEDVAFGGAGSETFHIQGGKHFIDGGSGIDTLRFDRQVFVDLRTTDEQKTSDTSWDTIRNVENLIGSRLADRLYGSDGDNTLAGVIGNDLLEGNNGDDLLIGGMGNDSLSGGAGTDVAEYNGTFADYTIHEQADGSYSILDKSSGNYDGSDTLIGVEYLQFADRTIALTARFNSAPTSIALSSKLVDGDAPVGTLVALLSGVDPDGDALGFSLVSNPGNHFRIHGDKLIVDRAFTDRSADIVITVRASDPHGASIDRTFTIDVDPDVFTVPPVGDPIIVNPANHADPADVPSLTLKGGKRSDILKGGEGDDRLNGGLGLDKLTGQGGEDVFAFSTKLSVANVDAITDFDSASDTVHLSRSIFKKLHKGALDNDAFCIGKTARDGEDRIVYDKKSGALSYDADGSGTEYGAIKFAQLKAKTLLKADHFFIG